MRFYFININSVFKVAVNTVIQDERDFLNHIIKSTNMKCLTPLFWWQLNFKLGDSCFKFLWLSVAACSLVVLIFTLLEFQFLLLFFPWILLLEKNPFCTSFMFLHMGWTPYIDNMRIVKIYICMSSWDDDP
ncbi:hypothetical protein RIF29_28440 [Crotalaria pallida]|uniref:Uncharacterized protein n=1 Tax=Crotalaria pallida TaxID=3830 RepID=A0AAN9HSZ6_CROPI